MKRPTGPSLVQVPTQNPPGCQVAYAECIIKLIREARGITGWNRMEVSWWQSVDSAVAIFLQKTALEDSMKWESCYLIYLESYAWHPMKTARFACFFQVIVLDSASNMPDVGAKNVMKMWCKLHSLSQSSGPTHWACHSLSGCRTNLQCMACGHTKCAGAHHESFDQMGQHSKCSCLMLMIFA